MDRIEKLYEESVSIENQIIRANLRLVVSIAKRYVGPAEDFFELVSDGNMSMIVRRRNSDVSQGNKFSTYASWAIIKISRGASLPCSVIGTVFAPASWICSAPSRTPAQTSTSRSQPTAARIRGTADPQAT